MSCTSFGPLLFTNSSPMFSSPTLIQILLQILPPPQEDMVACSFFSFSAPSSFLFHFLQEYVPSGHSFFACLLTLYFHQFILRTSFTIILPAILCCQCSFSKGLWGNQKREYFFNAYHRLKKKMPIEFNKYSYRNRRIRPVEQKGKFKDRCAHIYMGT